ncbi:VOC family protein [Neobacillus terrae]|uniref:VOC family protein n=1 Tax=Neobacillus terrae TaxID=3034837 RepID=UPI00140D4CE6|nr:VOC family protein [Neobacillus terrae]NHM30829.1 VOC family protein [Neobacillus terrae]
MSSFHRKPNIFVGQVFLKVEDINRSLSFYNNVIGFKILEQTERKAILSADGNTPLLTIEQPENVIPKQKRTTGLYHFAILLPNRTDLGKVLNHFLKLGYPLQGGSDHLVSEALYLADPDGNGIEIYVDRPSSNWNWENGEVLMATNPLDADSLLEEGKGAPWEALPVETMIGHIHLHVAELNKIKEFYCLGLGFNVVSKYGNQALFISTGGYHHHIGLNTWNGTGAPKPAKYSVGLERFSLVFPNNEARTKAVNDLSNLGYMSTSIDGDIIVEDPSGNLIQLEI